MKKFKIKHLKKISSSINKIKFINPFFNFLTFRKYYIKDNFNKYLFFIRQFKYKLGIKSPSFFYINNNFFFLKKYWKRLDIFLFNLGLFSSLYAVRQVILHKKIYVNGQAITSQNYLLKKGDVIKIEKSIMPALNNNLVKIAYNSNFFEFNYKTLTGVVLSSYIDSFDLVQKLILYKWLTKKK